LPPPQHQRPTRCAVDQFQFRRADDALPEERVERGLVDSAPTEEDARMSKMPPVPPEQRSDKGPGSDPNTTAEDSVPGRENFDSQGRQGNIKQNTTNQGYQQDR
jgi:hypothetical protein